MEDESVCACVRACVQNEEVLVHTSCYQDHNDLITWSNVAIFVFIYTTCIHHTSLINKLLILVAKSRHATCDK